MKIAHDLVGIIDFWYSLLTPYLENVSVILQSPGWAKRQQLVHCPQMKNKCESLL